MNQPNADLSNFSSILSLIKNAKERIAKTVNTEIIDLYWQIGKEVSEQAKNGGWGKSVVEELSNYIAANFGNKNRQYNMAYSIDFTKRAVAYKQEVHTSKQLREASRC